MPYQVENVALDPRFSMQRRQASRLQMEPQVAGQRLRLRSSVLISDVAFEANKGHLELLEKQGVALTRKVPDGAQLPDSIYLAGDTLASGVETSTSDAPPATPPADEEEETKVPHQDESPSPVDPAPVPPAPVPESSPPMAAATAEIQPQEPAEVMQQTQAPQVQPTPAPVAQPQRHSQPQTQSNKKWRR